MSKTKIEMTEDEIATLPKSRSEAAKVGSVLYFTGLPCKNGHVAPRYANGRCKVCTYESNAKSRQTDRHKEKEREYRKKNSKHISEREAAWRRRNQERVAENKKAYAEKNKEKLRAKAKEKYQREKERLKLIHKEWREKNKDRDREIKRLWHERNKEKLQIDRRKHYIANRELFLKRSAEWRENNRERYRVQMRNRKARLKLADGRHTAEEIAGLIASQNGRCVYCCADVTKAYHADHITPLSRGGSNWITNIQILCPTCNVRKNDKTHEEYLATISACPF